MPRSSRSTNRVRIIGGKWKGRKLAVASARIRPTPDRARVTLFNWLVGDLASARVLDLFAGTGVLGFEALARGASHTTFVDNDPTACRALERHRLELGADASVRRADGVAWLRNRPPDERWDLVFLDPPFDSALLHEVLHDVAARLAPSGVIYIEADAHFDWAAAERQTGLAASRTSHAGTSHYGLLRSVGEPEG